MSKTVNLREELPELMTRIRPGVFAGGLGCGSVCGAFKMSSDSCDYSLWFQDDAKHERIADVSKRRARARSCNENPVVQWVSSPEGPKFRP